MLCFGGSLCIHILQVLGAASQLTNCHSTHTFQCFLAIVYIFRVSMIKIIFTVWIWVWSGSCTRTPVSPRKYVDHHNCTSWQHKNKVVLNLTDFSWSCTYTVINFLQSMTEMWNIVSYMNVYSKHLCLFIIRPTKSTITVWKVVNKLTLILTNAVVVCPLWLQRALYSNAFQLQIQHNCRKQAEKLNLCVLKKKSCCSFIEAEFCSHTWPNGEQRTFCLPKSLIKDVFVLSPTTTNRTEAWTWSKTQFHSRY